MVFSSHIFLFYFLPIVLLLNYLLPFRFLTTMLTIVSYTFYGWANPKWIVLMLTSTLVDYFCGLALVRYSGLKPQEDGDLPFLPRFAVFAQRRAPKSCSKVRIIRQFGDKYAHFGLL